MFKMKKRQYISLLLTLIWLLWGSAYAQADEVYQPTLITEAPLIDGILNESIWKTACTACEATNLTVILPDTHEPASLKTFFKFVYTDKALYVGVTCEQPASTHVRRLGARDDTTVTRDAIRVMLDPSGKGHYGYLFDVGLGGSIVDGTIRPESKMNNDWDGPIKAVTTSDDNNWYVEMELPWDMMQFPRQEGKRRIGVLLRRFIPSLGEFWATPHLPMISSVYLSAFAPMEIEDINPKGRFTFYPYVAVGYNSVKEKTEENIGADVFWQPSPGLLASATINPDYGDVESDKVVVNLSAVETFYEEKRSFFVEGNDIFKTWSATDNGLNLVHTRRIGSTPDKPVVEGATSVTSLSVRSDIISALKATGQIGELRYGFMTAFEDDNDFLVNHPVKGVYEISGESRDFYTARILYEHSNNKLGYLGTYTVNPAYEAWVHSVDDQWLSTNQQWRLENQAAVSNKDGEQGFAWNGRLNYSQIRKQEVMLSLDYIDDQFNCNDFGYLGRNDQFGFNLEYANYDTPVKKLKELRWFLFVKGKANEHLIDPEIGGRAMMNFQNLTSLTAELKYLPESWNDKYILFEWRDLNSLGYRDYRKEPGFKVDFMGRTNPSKPVSFEFQPTVYTENNGGITRRLRVNMDFDFMDEWQNNIAVDYYNKEDLIVWSSSSKRLFGYNSDELTVTMNSGFQIAQNQELRVGIQWIGVDAEGKTAYDIGVDGDLIKNNSTNAAAKSFNSAKFVAQVRYKYEFAPLSDLYLVYNRGSNLDYRGDNYIQDDFGNLLSDSIDKKDVDLILVKVRYRF